MSTQQDSEEKGKKPTKSKEKEVRIKYRIFLGEFTLDEYFQKEVNLIIAKMKQEGNK
ncbi:hypothetical protein P9E76_15565 [Schinkia azotoformans]|uniref:hypothetical protein n=1 Tax=Schinkia azotoformans TaxID=1454 RepID=UPI00031D307C|nr:hypothetical protein [Schinkia azotoformans]MEC1638104.1 hypothetical protein [Schinkia azotoformans]MEC1946462.1 hypothetical protein [Schinkia azotoformans]